MELDRRRFLQMAGSASLVGAVGGRFGWASSARFVYIGAEHAIHVYSVSADDRLVERQTVVSAFPVAMAARGGRLYVANGVSEYGNLPRGSVEAFALDQATGRLEWMNRMPLSLSGTAPRDLAVAPDGRSVVVAVHGGGAYNALSLDETNTGSSLACDLAPGTCPTGITISGPLLMLSRWPTHCDSRP